MAQTMISLRVDNDLKKSFDDLCKEFGLSSSAAMTLFMKAVVRERRIPFEIRAESPTTSLQQTSNHPQTSPYAAQTPMGAQMPMGQQMPMGTQMPIAQQMPMGAQHYPSQPLHDNYMAMEPQMPIDAQLPIGANMQQMGQQMQMGEEMQMGYGAPNANYNPDTMNYGQVSPDFPTGSPIYPDMVRGYAPASYEPGLFDGMEPQPATPVRKMTIDDISYEAVHAQLNGKKKDK